MSSDDTPSRQEDLPLEGEPEQPSETTADSGELAIDQSPWSVLTDPATDPTGANLFSSEIENVNASDWDIDTALIWGDESDDAPAGDSGMDLDFPL